MQTAHTYTIFVFTRWPAVLHYLNIVMVVSKMTWDVSVMAGPSSNDKWNNEQGWRDSINRENRIAAKSLFVYSSDCIFNSAS